jgi:NADH-quinone oxidoreductase subunit C/D
LDLFEPTVLSISRTINHFGLDKSGIKGISMVEDLPLLTSLKERYDEKVIFDSQVTADNTLTIWVFSEKVAGLLRFLKYEINRPFRMLFDLTAIDERRRSGGSIPQSADFTIVYHLTSFERNEDIRIKVPLNGVFPSLGSITGIWPSANWYEREIFDMFGIKFTGHPYMHGYSC